MCVRGETEEPGQGGRQWQVKKREELVVSTFKGRRRWEKWRASGQAKVKRTGKEEVLGERNG